MNIEIVYTQGRFSRGFFDGGKAPDKLNRKIKVFDCRLGTPLARSLNEGLTARLYWLMIFSFYKHVLLLDTVPLSVRSVVDDVIHFYSGEILVSESQGE